MIRIEIEKNEITKPKTTKKRVPKSKMDMISNENQIQYSLFDTKQKIYESTSTLMDLRVSPFMPVDKISHNSALAKEFVANKNILVPFIFICPQTKFAGTLKSDDLGGLNALPSTYKSKAPFPSVP